MKVHPRSVSYVDVRSSSYISRIAEENFAAGSGFLLRCMSNPLIVTPVMASSSLVYFEGEWLEDEKALVETGAEAAESVSSITTDTSPGAPWVAAAYVVGERPIYIASRHGFCETFRARTARDLAEKMVQFEGLRSLP